MNLTDPDTLQKLGKLVLTDLVLAGDNALVIALATRSLPPRQQFWGRMVGAGGAVGLRVLFVAIFAMLLKIPLLQLVGGLLLLWISWNLIRPQAESLEAATESGKFKATSLGKAISVIIVADLTMSFDNVVAISSISGDSMSLVIFGLALSIPLVVWGSVLIAKLMERFRWIIWLGGAVLGHVAGEIIFKDQHMLRWMGIPIEHGATAAVQQAAIDGASPFLRYLIHGIPWVLGVLFFLAGWLFSRRAAAHVPKAEAHSA
jgi:YjbE family integral membrane protein